MIDLAPLVAPDEEWALKIVLEELTNAQENHPAFVNAHEGFAVLLEEVDELWDVVRLNPRKHPERQERLMAEAKQVAAMALRFLIDLGGPGDPLPDPQASSTGADLGFDPVKRAAWFTGP